jgi:dihydroorotate dehydrogenase (NAD+) catalytic subunit
MSSPTDIFYDPAKSFDENFDHGPWLQPYTYHKPTAKPAYTLLGQPVHLPFGIPSCSVLTNSAFVGAAFDRGFDVLTYKTQRSAAFPVNPFPNIIPIAVDGPVSLETATKGLTLADGWGDDPKRYSITNSFGNGTYGPDSWVPDLKKAVGMAHPGQLLIASVVGTIQQGFSEQDYWADFAKTAEMAKSTGVHAIELNLSCPNVAGEGVVCYTREADKEICRLAKQAIGDTPLLAKFGYFAENQQELLEAIVADIAPYVQAIAAINTIPAAIRNKDGTPALPGEGRLVSGLSGVAIKWAGLDMVKRLAALRQRKGYDYEIIGIGGVMTPQDYQEYRDAGADAVQSAAGTLWNPKLAAEIKEFLA